MKKIFEKMFEEIKSNSLDEAIFSKSSARVVKIDSSSSDESDSEEPNEGEPVEGEPVEGDSDGEESGEDSNNSNDGVDSDGKKSDGKGSDQDSSDSDDGEESDGKGDSKGTEEVDVDTSNGPKLVDDHDSIEEGGGGSGDFRKIFSEVEKTARKVSSHNTHDPGSGGGAAGGIMEQVNGFIHPPFDVEEVMKRLNKFKRLVAQEEVESRDETYMASAFNPVNQRSRSTNGGRMNQPGSVKIGKDVKPFKKSAMMFFAIDTSGSICYEDFQAIKGYLDEISARFAKQLAIRDPKTGKILGTVSGEIYLIEWDTQLYPPLRKWTRVDSSGKVIADVTVPKRIKNPSKEAKNRQSEINKDTASMEVRGRGGNHFNNVLKQIDGLFLATEGKKNYFLLDDNDSEIIATDRDKFSKGEDVGNTKYKKIVTKVELPPQKDSKPNPRKAELNMNSGAMNFLETQTDGSQIPFLLVYTDGGEFEKVNYKNSKLYANNPGNIMYICTSKYHEQLTPKNIVFHDFDAEKKRKR